MINAVVHLRMFDAVMQHAFRVQHPKGNGSIILQEDYEKFEKARVYALTLNRMGLLQEFYKRLVKEAL